jgi:hypothetical protein
VPVEARGVRWRPSCEAWRPSCAWMAVRCNHVVASCEAVEARGVFWFPAYTFARCGTLFSGWG